MPLPQAGLPPQLAAGPASVGPATVPQGNPGNTQAAMTKIRNAVTLLETALPDIPMGSELHAEILKVTAQLAKKMTDSGDNKGLELQSLIKMAKESAQSAPMAAMARMFPQQGAPAMAPAGASPVTA